MPSITRADASTPPLPTGTLTFLLTDIEGSTRLWQEAPDAMQIEAWPPLSPIRVRMALHSGPAELRNGDYFGQPLNQVARLLSAGHGGQTLVSSVTRELCHDRLPAGAALKSL